MKNFTIKTQGTCARQIEFGLENGRLHHIHFQGGCSGNLAAISKLLEGADARHTVELLKGNTCGNRPTSCADQLARGVEEALKEE